MKTQQTSSCKRPYTLGKRLEQMSRTKSAILIAAREQLQSGGIHEFSMESLAAASGVTRQTIHNLFGTRAGLLEALFDQIARDGGMERMREVMTSPDPESMLLGFIEVFTEFWAGHRLLLRRIHGMAAIEPEFSRIIEQRNMRRKMAAGRVIQSLAGSRASDAREEKIAVLVALTSFEFYDVLAEAIGAAEPARDKIRQLICAAIVPSPKPRA